jgi:ankyrin repeat protein
MRLILTLILITSVSKAVAGCGGLCDRQWWESSTLEDLNILANDGKYLKDRDAFGQTPLHWAALMGTAEQIKILLDAGASLKVRTETGQTVLHLASAFGKPDAIKVLLNAGADLQSKNASGYSPLHEAAEFGASENIKTLIEAGADIMARGDNGNTPLHRAAQSQDPKDGVIEALLAAGADAKAKNFYLSRFELTDKNGNRIRITAPSNSSKEQVVEIYNCSCFDEETQKKLDNSKTPWELAQENSKLKGKKGYWALNDAQYD